MAMMLSNPRDAYKDGVRDGMEAIVSLMLSNTLGKRNTKQMLEAMAEFIRHDGNALAAVLTAECDRCPRLFLHYGDDGAIDSVSLAWSRDEPIDVTEVLNRFYNGGNHD